mmetsp:Transcript_97175/g.274866  ORF Transcript_97175/g.274866 Transcript_97175/m.274866 type:complete len:224 (-) Transcript_97175:3318-3989(-)
MQQTAQACSWARTVRAGQLPGLRRGPAEHGRPTRPHNLGDIRPASRAWTAEQEHAVVGCQRVEPVRDGEHGRTLEGRLATSSTTLQHALHQRIRLGVAGAGGLVADHNTCAAERGPCNGQELALARRYGGAALGQGRIQPAFRGVGQRLELHQAQGPLQFRVWHPLQRVEVLAQRARVDEGHLRDNSDGPTQHSRWELPHINPVQSHLTGCHLKHPEEAQGQC